MTEYFKKDQLESVKKQKKNVLLVFFAVFGVYILASVGFLVWYFFLPYEDGRITLIKCLHLPLTGIFVIFSFIYLGIKYRRCNKFYKFCLKLDGGKKENSRCTYCKTNDELIEREGVDCKELIFIEWNKYKGEYFERAVLVFYEIDFPKLKEKCVYDLVTQGNFLISYSEVE